MQKRKQWKRRWDSPDRIQRTKGSGAIDRYDSTILIVDDEAALSQMVKELLLRDGYKKVEIAGNCAGAKRYIKVASAI